MNTTLLLIPNGIGLTNILLMSNFTQPLAWRIALLSIFCSFLTFAQNPEIILKSSLNSALQKSKSGSNQKAIKELLDNHVPTVYVHNGNITGDTDKPVKAYSDLSEANKLQSIPNKGTIENITLNVKNKSDLNLIKSVLDFKKFPRLKVLYLRFDFDVQPSDFSSFIPYHEDFSWIVVYEIIKPS